MRSLRTLPTIFNCFKYSTYVVVKPDGVSWSAYGLFYESHDVIGGAVKDSTQLLQRDQRDILILFQCIQRFVVDAAFEKLVLGHFPFLHRLP